jgi:hypothetical protein
VLCFDAKWFRWNERGLFRKNGGQGMLVCIDWRESERSPWQKEWEVLGRDGGGVLVRPLELAEARKPGALANVALVLLHGSVFENPFPRYRYFPPVREELLKLFDGCIGVVTEGGYSDAVVTPENGFPEGRITDGGRVCFVRTGFPAKNLSFLAPTVARLVQDLTGAIAIKGDDRAKEAALRRAWHRFDKERCSGILAAASILCQGFLAVQLRAKRDIVTLASAGSTGRLALDQMAECFSWLSFGKDAELQAEVESVDYWAVFGGYSDLQKAAKDEWDRENDPRWGEVEPLIALVAKGEGVPRTQVGLVIAAHCALRERLGGAV